MLPPVYVVVDQVLLLGGDEDGLAVQAAGVGVVVHRAASASGRRSATSMRSCSGVDATDELGELGGVAAHEDPLRADSAARILGPKTMVPTWKPAVGDHTDEGFGLLVGGADQVEHHVERCPLNRDR